MKRILIIIFLSSLVSVSCIREVDNSADLQIDITLPSDVDVDIDMSKITVKLQNSSNPFVYTKNADKNGHVEFHVQPGKYDLLASCYYESSRIAVNASKTEFILIDEGIVSDDGSIAPANINMTLNVAVPSPLVIRELYYHGSSTLEGAAYTKDQYIEIYNNSGPDGDVVFLDSLCIAVIHPANSTTSNNAWKGLDTIPIFQMFWYFPGNGTSYPLAPGESSVIATRAAVDHSGRATSGLHLELSHFGCYDDILSGHEIAAGVPRMVCHITGQGSAWAMSISSPAIVLFKPKMGVSQYLKQAHIWERYEPGMSSGTKYWHISKEWIMDGVECADSPEGAIKRLPGTVDASYVWMRSPHYSGKCITRALQGVFDGIEVFMDTNNSSEDFIPDSTPAPRLKK
jgi:hypothetical protein